MASALASARPAPWRVAFVSFAVLVLELALIREIPAEVKAVSYFTNLILMATFFGLGIGCLLEGRRRLDWLLPAGLAMTLGFVLAARGITSYAEAESVHYWAAANPGPGATARPFPLLATALAAFFCAALPFVGLGQRLAREMDRHPRLTAYAWDIAGSLGGTLAFAAGAAGGIPPWAWIAALLVAWAFVFPERWWERAIHAAAGLAFLACARSPFPAQWSPYYFIQYDASHRGVDVYVNSSFHQHMVDFTAPPQSVQKLRDRWGRAYVLFRGLNQGRNPGRVLILGAGTGNDVVMALENGAQRVVAVEIDPAILALGRRLNPRHPYDDPRVQAVVDDARHFLKTSPERFDLIIFGTLDSQALLSGHANLRLENYVYTQESLGDARALLNDRGLVVVLYSVFRPWLWNRLYATMRSVFGENSALVREDEHIFFNTQVIGVRGVPGARDSPQTVAEFGTGAVSTDDWPFIYLERRTIAPLYLQLIGVVTLLLIGTGLLVRRRYAGTTTKIHFGLLGLGFTLMESSAVVRMALLFGSTWVVNVVVFAGVLFVIFLANAMALKGRVPSLHASWAGLLGGILANYAIPVAALAGLPGPLRAIAAGALIGWPVFCAALCFSALFRDERATGRALGLNLVGAMSGGLVEYVSMLTGMRAIWLITLGIYTGAWLSSRRRTAD